MDGITLFAVEEVKKRAGDEDEEEEEEEGEEQANVRGFVYKEVPDKYGADATWFEQTEDGKGYIMKRAQLKLGTSLMKYDEFVEVVDKLVAGSKQALQLLDKQLGVVKVENIVAITRPRSRKKVKKTAKGKVEFLLPDAYAENNGVTLWDKEELAKRWCPAVKAWAKQAKASVYLSAAEVQTLTAATTATTAASTTITAATTTTNGE